MTMSYEAYNGGAVRMSGTSTFYARLDTKVHRVSATGTQDFILPDARLFKVGGPIFYVWATGDTLEIRSVDVGVSLGTVTTGNIAAVYLLDNSTAVGTWIVVIKAANTATTGLFANRDLRVVYSAGPSNVHSKYDFSAATWSADTTSTYSREFSVGFRLAEAMFLNGYNSAVTRCKRVERWKSGAWAVMTDHTVFHVKSAGDAVNGIGYMMSGETNLSCTAYAQLTDAWSVLADSPYNRSRSVARGVAGRLYLIAGLPALQPSFKYFPKDDTFENITDYTTFNRHDIAAFALKQWVFTMGGYDLVTHTDAVEAYNTLTDAWVVTTSLPSARYSGAGISDSEIGYYCGGANSSDTLQNSAHDYRSGTWASIGTMPTTHGRVAGSGVAL